MLETYEKHVSGVRCCPRGRPRLQQVRQFRDAVAGVPRRRAASCYEPALTLQPASCPGLRAPTRPTRPARRGLRGPAQLATL